MFVCVYVCKYECAYMYVYVSVCVCTKVFCVYACLNVRALYMCVYGFICIWYGSVHMCVGTGLYISLCECICVQT